MIQLSFQSMKQILNILVTVLTANKHPCTDLTAHRSETIFPSVNSKEANICEVRVC